MLPADLLSTLHDVPLATAMETLLSEMSVRSDLVTLSHRVCEVSGPYAAKHGVEDLLTQIQCTIDTASSSGDQESALMGLAVRILGVSGAAHLSAIDPAHSAGNNKDETQGGCCENLRLEDAAQQLKETSTSDVSQNQEGPMRVQARPDDSLIAELFELYDLDHSGTMNSHNELLQLSINLVYKCGARVEPDVIRERVGQVEESTMNWDLEEFKEWFFLEFESEFLGAATACTDSTSLDI